MALTVGEILNMEEFREYRVLCGKKGLGREVSTVTVMDTPNIQDWLRGGEIVLSSGFLLQQLSQDERQQLITQLADSEACALFVKLGTYMQTLDEETVRAANETGLPIVSAPAGCILSDIISPIIKKLIDMQSSALRLSENISTSFINTVINDGGITDVVNTIATLLNQNIAFYDLAFNKIYPSKNASLRDGFKESFLSYPHLRVSLEDKDYGFIVIIDDSRQELSDYETMILTHASTALKLIAQKYISNMEIETRYRDGFVQDIVLNNIKSLQEVVKRGKIYGWDLSEKFYTAVIVDIDDFKIQYLNIRSKEDSETIEKHNDDIFDYSLKFFRRFFKTVLYTKFTDSTAFIIKHDKPDEATAQKILSCCNTLKGELQAAYNFTVTIGISEPKGSIMDCHIAYQEAQKAVKISRLVYKRDNTATYSALGIYKFLDGIKDNPSVQEFYKGYIEKIYRHDELHNTDFMETLVNIVQNGWNLKLASDTMFLHYNTIKYRYKKIEEISGLNLDRTEEKLSMELAVKIYLMTHI